MAASISAIIWANGTAGVLLPFAMGLALVVICALAALGDCGMRDLAVRYSARQIGTEVFLRGLEPRARRRSHLHIGLICLGAALLATGVTLSFPGRIAAVPVLAALLTLVLLRLAGAMGSKAHVGWIFDALVPPDVLLEATNSSGPLARFRAGWTSAGRLEALRSAAALDPRVPGDVREIILAQYSPEAMFVPVKLQPKGVASEAMLMLAGWRMVLPVCVIAAVIALLLVLLVPRDALHLPAFDDLRFPFATQSDDPPADPESPKEAAAQDAEGQSSDADQGSGNSGSAGEMSAGGRDGGSAEGGAGEGGASSTNSGAEGASGGAEGNLSDGQGSGEAAGKQGEGGGGTSGSGQGREAGDPQDAGEGSGGQGSDGGDPGGSTGGDAAGSQGGKGSDAGAGEGDSGASSASPAGAQGDSGGNTGTGQNDPAEGTQDGSDVSSEDAGADAQGSGSSDEAKGDQGSGSGEAPRSGEAQGSSGPEPAAQADDGGGTPGSGEDPQPDQSSGEQSGSNAAGEGSPGGRQGGTGEQATGEGDSQGNAGPGSSGPVQGSQPDAGGSQQGGEGTAGAPQGLAGQDVQGDHPVEGEGFGQASTSADPSGGTMTKGPLDASDGVETITQVPVDELPDELPDGIEIAEGDLPPDAQGQEITALAPSAGDAETEIGDAPELRQAAEMPEGVTSPDLKVGAASALFAEKGEVPVAVEARLPSGHAEPAPADTSPVVARQILPAWIAEFLE